MIHARVLRVALHTVCAAALGLCAVVVWSWARGVTPLPPTQPAGGRTGGPAGDSVTAPSLSALLTHDPFRARRAPAAVAYDPVVLAAGPPPPAPPKPVLTLTGIAWGTEPEAVIEGMPTTDGPRVVRQGDAVGGLRVKLIALDHVVIAGMDTTWTLKVREPWK